MKACAALLVLTATALLNGGCLVIDIDHTSKPVASHRAIEFRRENDRRWFDRQFHEPDLDINVGFRDQVRAMEIGFILWVLPLPFPASKNIERWDVRVEIKPAPGVEVLIDPSRICYVPSQTVLEPGNPRPLITSQVPVKPVKLFRDDGNRWTALPMELTPVTNRVVLVFRYEVPCDPDMPFEVSVDGLSVSGRRFTTLISYKRARIVYPEFRLPY